MVLRGLEDVQIFINFASDPRCVTMNKKLRVIIWKS